MLFIQVSFVTEAVAEQLLIDGLIKKHVLGARSVHARIGKGPEWVSPRGDILLVSHTGTVRTDFSGTEYFTDSTNKYVAKHVCKYS